MGKKRVIRQTMATNPFILGFLAFGACVLLSLHEWGVSVQLGLTAFISATAFFCTYALIPAVAAKCIDKGIFGRDINKQSDKPVSGPPPPHPQA